MLLVQTLLFAFEPMKTVTVMFFIIWVC